MKFVKFKGKIYTVLANWTWWNLWKGFYTSFRLFIPTYLSFTELVETIVKKKKKAQEVSLGVTIRDITSILEKQILKTLRFSAKLLITFCFIGVVCFSILHNNHATVGNGEAAPAGYRKKSNSTRPRTHTDTPACKQTTHEERWMLSHLCPFFFFNFLVYFGEYTAHVSINCETGSPYQLMYLNSVLLNLNWSTEIEL